MWLNEAVVVVAVLAVLTSASHCSKAFYHDDCIYELEGCQWDEHQHYCYMPGEQEDVPCERFGMQYECEKAGCQFSEDLQRCHSGGGIPCHHWSFQQDCESSPNCKWANTICYDARPESSCKYIYNQEACLSMSNCDWQSQHFQCYDKSTGIECGLRPLIACEADGRCTYNTDAHRCLEKDAKLSCDQFFGKEPCLKYSKCEWSDAINMCHRKGKPIPCFRIYDRIKCEQESGCEFSMDAHFCHTKGQKIPCNRYHMRETCLETLGCEWSKDAERCIDIGEEVKCRDIRNAKGCENAGCEFYNGVCLEEGQRKDCAEYTLPIKCTQVGCLWNITCQDMPIHGQPVGFHPPAAPVDLSNPPDPPKIGGDSPAILSGVPHGAPDANSKPNPVPQIHPPGSHVPHEALSAKQQGLCIGIDCDETLKCAQDEVKGTHSKECCPRCSHLEGFCNQFHAEDVCPDGCEYHASARYCTALGAFPPCDALTTSPTCERNPQCEWHQKTRTCIIQGTPVECSRLRDGKSCGIIDYCKFDNVTNICFKPGAVTPCKTYQMPDLCNSVPQCEYDHGAFVCKNKGEILPCLKYKVEEACNALSNCVYDDDAEVCLPKNVNTPCKAYKEKGPCEAAKDGCFWDDIESDCVRKGSFEPLPCHEFHMERGCQLQAGCKYWPEVFVCTKEDEKPPCHRLHSKELCALNPECVFHEKALTCAMHNEEIPCERYVGQSGCQSDNRCQWMDSIFLCTRKGPIPCARLNQPDLCRAQSHCEYLEESVLCIVKGAQVPCTHLFTAAACGQHPAHCRWSDPQRTCIPKEISNCEVLFDGNECNAAPGCKWHQNARLCHKASETVPCHRVHQQQACSATTGCGWDEKDYKCRTVRHRGDL